MKNFFRKNLLALFTLAVLFGIFSVSVSAATRKCYTISNGNTTVYSNSGLSRRYGTIYGSDEVTVLDVTDQYSRVCYLISGGRTKIGYIHTSEILLATSGVSYKAGARITTYRRPGGVSYGYIDKNDKVTILGRSGNYTQVKYPVSGGYKYAFVTTDHALRYLTGLNNESNSGNMLSVTDGTYVLQSKLDNNKVLDANGNSSVKNGTNMEICTYNGGTNQQFAISHDGAGWYKIICVWGNKSLDVDKGRKGNEVNVALYDWHGGDNQLWRFVSAGDGYFYIQSKLGYYLDVWNNCTADGTNVQIYQFNGGNNQKWKLERKTAYGVNLADELVKTAKSQLGMRERSVGSDDILYNDWYYGYRVSNRTQAQYAWCASFVAWCADQTGLLGRVFPKTANTTSMKNGLLSRGGILHLKDSSYRPVHGDIIFFGNNAGKHIGIVDYTSGNMVYYIDGNNTNMSPHGVNYSSCSLGYRDLWGFVTPAYGR